MAKNDKAPTKAAEKKTATATGGDETTKPTKAAKYVPVWMEKDGAYKQAMKPEFKAHLESEGWEESDYDPTDVE